MRTYAENVASPSQAQNGQQQQQQKQQQTRQNNHGHALHLQIADIATQLGSTVASAAANQANAATSHMLAQPQEAQGQPQEPERRALVANIRQLETSLASIPDCQEYKHIRDAIMVQIEQAKTRLNSTKPLAARLEGCQEALTRAQKRLTETQSLVQLAIAARDQASGQVAKYQAELAEVQTLIAKQAETTRGGTCLQKLHTQMQVVLTEMTSSSHLEPGETHNVMQQMHSLYSQINGLAAKAQMSAQATAASQNIEQKRLQQLLIENAVAQSVDVASFASPVVLAQVASETMVVDSPVTQAPADNSTVGEPSSRVITGGG